MSQIAIKTLQAATRREITRRNRGISEFYVVRPGGRICRNGRELGVAALPGNVGLNALIAAATMLSTALGAEDATAWPRCRRGQALNSPPG